MARPGDGLSVPEQSVHPFDGTLWTFRVSSNGSDASHSDAFREEDAGVGHSALGPGISMVSRNRHATPACNNARRHTSTPTAMAIDSAHQQGDIHAMRGLKYESGQRCLWLLDLHRTGGSLTRCDGEDAKYVSENGDVAFRQVKKRDDAWTYGEEFRKFVERAYGRFRSDS